MTIEKYRANKADERSTEDSIVESSFDFISRLGIRPQTKLGYWPLQK